MNKYIMTGKYVDCRSKEIVGVRISRGTEYEAAVTIEKAKELNVEDIDIVQYLDVYPIEVVAVGEVGYAILDKSDGFLSDYADVMLEDMGDLYYLYGHVFKKHFLCKFDVEAAIRRLNEGLEGIG